MAQNLSIDEQDAQLRREDEELARRIKADRARREAIAASLHRLQLLRLVDVPSGVRIRFRSRSGSEAALNDALGTITQVRRTKASVDFGAAGKWEMPIDNLAPASAPQGIKF